MSSNVGEESPITKGALLEKILYTESQMEEFESKFKNDTDTVRKGVQGVLNAMKILKGALNRQRVKMVADLTIEGKLNEASTKLKENYVALETGQMEEILQVTLMSGTGSESLKNAINFVDFVELKSAACKFLYEEMRFLNRLGDAEILLLQFKMKGLDDKLLAETKTKIAADVDKLIKRLAEEAEKGEAVLSKKVIETCSNDVFDTVIPIIIEKFFALPSSNAKQLVKYSQEFPNLSNSCILVGAAFEHLKKKGLLRTEPALHLWARARYLMMEEKNFPQVSGANQRLVKDCQNEMSLHQDYYFEVFKEKVNEKKLTDFVGKNWYMKIVLGEFVKLFYAGKRQQYKQLAAAWNGLPFYNCIGRVQKSLYEEMEKFDHLPTFEAFQLYHFVQKTTKNSNYDAANKNMKDIEYVRAKVPKCLIELLWSENTKCRIVNKYFDEPLFLEGSGDVHSWVPCIFRENQLWTAGIDKDTSLVLFTHCDDDVNQLGCKSQDAVTTLCAGTTGTKWMIKAVDDDHVKIFKSEDEYLTTELNNSGSKRSVNLRKENSTDMQLWKLDFTP